MRVRQRTHSLRVIWAPSIARRLIRHRLFRAALVVALGVAAALTLSSKSAALEHERTQWGDMAEVIVVHTPVDAGEQVARYVETTMWPQALVPNNAATSIAADALAKVPLYAGEVLLADRITAPGSRPDGTTTVALTLPVVVQVPLIRDGDLVDLWIVDSANLSSQRAVEHVVVLAFSDRDITVAVPRDQIAAATAASLRAVTVALIG